jgi:flagellar biosynthesis GTPase FlhF
VSWKPLSSLIKKQAAGINTRLEHIENQLHHALIGVSNAWVAHPLYGALLQQRMHPATINKIFNQVVERGFTPDTTPAELKPLIAEELGKMLARKPTGHTGEPVVFIGPSGSGKTALLLKLARNPGFFGRANTAVVILDPQGKSGLALQDPVSIYKRFSVPVVSVRSATQMQNVLPHLGRFDQLLIDTPSMPARAADARPLLQEFKDILDPLPKYRVEFVVSTTRILEHFTAGYVALLPLQPASVAVTHLDETLGWGRVADWLLALKLPVRFASTSSRIPDGIQRFSPNWFSHAIMNT